MSADPKKSIVIVTGSSGFIGQAAVKRLAKGHTVIGFDRFFPPHPPQEAECICVDLTSDSSIDAAFNRVRTAYGNRIASIVHLAAYFDLTGKPNPKYEEVTVRGTGRLLRHAAKFQVDQFVFVSTMLVHAPSTKGAPIIEDSPLDAKLPYRASKLRSEELLHEQRGKVPIAIVRPAGVYDDQCHNIFLAHQIARIYERSPAASVYPGDLETGQSYIHLDDLTDALARVIDRRAELEPETTLLLGEADAPSYGTLQGSLGLLIHDKARRRSARRACLHPPLDGGDLGRSLRTRRLARP
jgi:nucleoside-diphosphate-sugar epimerase